MVAGVGFRRFYVNITKNVENRKKGKGGSLGVVEFQLHIVGGERLTACEGGENTTFKKMTIEREEGDSELVAGRGRTEVVKLVPTEGSKETDVRKDVKLGSLGVGS